MKQNILKWICGTLPRILRDLFLGFQYLLCNYESIFRKSSALLCVFPNRWRAEEYDSGYLLVRYSLFVSVCVCVCAQERCRASPLKKRLFLQALHGMSIERTTLRHEHAASGSGKEIIYFRKILFDFDLIYYIDYYVGV